MKKLFSILTLAFLATFSVAQASELDNENEVKNQQRFAADLPQTLVVRVAQDGTRAVMHSNELLSKDVKVDGAKFVEMKATDRMGSELDKDSSTSGWFFYWTNYSWYYPTYAYYGYNYYYQPYYNYYAYGYSYYYYRWWW